MHHPDITERKNAEKAIRALNENLEQRVAERTAQLKAVNQALTQSEERFRLLVEGVQDYAIFMLSPKGGSQAGTKEPNASRVTKLSEIIGKHFSLFYPPEAIAKAEPEEQLKKA